MKYSMKLLNAGAAIAALLMNDPTYAATNASATPSPQNSWYFGASGDLTWLRHSDTGGGGNVELGYRFWPTNSGDFRIEAEAGYHSASGSSGYNGTHYFSYMGNLYYDFNTAFSTDSRWHVVPYIGGGLGDAAVHFGSGNFSSTFHHHENDFAYEGMAGLTLTSNSMPGTDWSIGYRYLGTDTHNINSNNIELGVRFHF